MKVADNLFHFPREQILSKPARQGSYIESRHQSLTSTPRNLSSFAEQEMNTEQQLEQRRVDSHKNIVRHLPLRGSSPQEESNLPVISRMNYQKIDPSIRSQNDLYVIQAVDMAWHCLHAMMSLPCLGLSKEKNENTTSTRKRSAAALSEKSLYISTTESSNMEKILHNVGMSERSCIMTVEDLEKGYRKFNDLAQGLSYSDLLHVCHAMNIGQQFSLRSANCGQWKPQTCMAFQFHVVMPIQQVFSRLFPDRRYTLEPLDKKFIAERNNKESFTARPDFMFSVNDQPLVSLEVQYPHVKFFHKKHFVPVFTQAVYQCLCCKTRYGVITDYFTTMVFRIELQDEDFKEIRENTYPVPIGEFTLGLKRLRIVYVMVRHDQSKDTLTAIVAQHIALAHEEMLDDKGREATERGMEYLAKALTLTEEEREERDQAAYGQFLSRSTSDQSGKGGLKIFDRVCDTSEYTVLQEGRANAQVLKIGRRLFEEITGKRATADSYILKIFDPVHGKRNHGDVSSDIESTKKSALREYGVYQKLKGLWGVCVPILYHSGADPLSLWIVSSKS